MIKEIPRRSRLMKSFAMIFAFACLSAIVGSAFAQKSGVSKQAEAWRKQPPKSGPARPFNLPAAREIRFDNGLTLLMIEDYRTPMVTLVVSVPVGNVHDSAEEIGLAEAVAELLTEGAGARTSEQFAREVEMLGGRLSSFAGDDYSQASVSVVAENAERMMDILGDAILRPTFPEDEVALYKDNRIQSLTVQRQDPAFLVSEQFNRVVYGPHPYALSAPTPEAVAAMDRAKIERFYKSNYTPKGSVMVIAGDFNPAKMEAKARAMFDKWKAPTAAERKFPAMPEHKARRIYLIDRPGSEQAGFRIGNLAIAHSDGDYFPMIVANTILGGGTSSRLFLNLREEKGYTYDVYSSVRAPLHRGTFFGGAETRTEVTVAAIKEMLAEYDRMRNEKVSAEDLRNAKNYLNGVFSLVLSTQGGVAGQMAATHMLGLGQDYLKTYRSRIEAVTAEQIQQAARRHILTDRPAIVVVGDAARLKKELSTLGPVEALDIEGKEVK